MHRPTLFAASLFVVSIMACPLAASDGYRIDDRGLQIMDEPRGSSNSRYGASRGYRDEARRNWAVGTFYGRNGANGNEETLTIRPDGSAELRTKGEAPQYGTFAGETLTIGSRISKVQPARGGLVIDGAYYRR